MLSLSLFGKTLKNPCMAASGCYGFGREAKPYAELQAWGALVSKGLTLQPRIGNPSPRICETEGGMLNSVGLQNPGLEAFLERELPFMQGLGPQVIVNVAGSSAEDYARHCARLDGKDILAIELNLSCPNVAKGCMAIGSDAKLLGEAVRAARKATTLPLIAKLTPNVTDIGAMALAAEAAGADAISLVNTFLGMAVNLEERRPVLRNNTGGLSGPAIKPLALRMCAEVASKVQVPILAMGGIMTARDVLEYILCGATAVQLGVFNFLHPTGLPALLSEMEGWMQKEGLKDLGSLRGQLQYW